MPTITAAELDTSIGITEATPAFTRQSDLIATQARNELRDGRTTIQVMNPNAHKSTISHGAVLANFKTLTHGQANHVRPMLLEQLTLASSHREDADIAISQLFQTPNSTVNKRLYPTLETREDPTKLN